MIPERPLRSLALNFDEGDDIDRLRRGYTLGADAVAFDLEDQVPRSGLKLARGNVRAVVEEYGATTPTFVRVNQIDRPEILDDLEAVVCQQLHAVLLPKVASPNDVIVLDRLLSLSERRAGLNVGSTLIVPLLETASGLRLAYEVGAASPRVAYAGGCVSKNGDPAISIGFRWTRSMAETSYIRQKGLLDMRAAGVRYPMSGIWNPLDDNAGLEQFAVESRNIGYLGMIVLPVVEHIEIVNRVFSPTQADVDFWSQIVPVVEKAETHVFVDGEMFPPNKVKWGRRELELAAFFGIDASPDAAPLVVDHVGAMSDSIRAVMDARGRPS